MDGQSRTCIEWMCNDEYEPGSFDLANIMSPPDHESIFHSLMNATPLGGEEWQGGSAGAPGGPQLAGDTPASLVSLVQRMELTPADQNGVCAGAGGAVPTTCAGGPSLTQAVADVLSDVGGGSSDGGADSSGGLLRVTSASKLSELEVAERPPPLVRRPSVSCPNSPPTRRAVGNSFFTPSVFDPERPAEICRQWKKQHPQEQAAAAMPSSAALASAGGMTGAAPPRKSRTKPRPSRLRELNFMAPTSM